MKEYRIFDITSIKWRHDDRRWRNEQDISFPDWSGSLTHDVMDILHTVLTINFRSGMSRIFGSGLVLRIYSITSNFLTMKSTSSITKKCSALNSFDVLSLLRISRRWCHNFWSLCVAVSSNFVVRFRSLMNQFRVYSLFFSFQSISKRFTTILFVVTWSVDTIKSRDRNLESFFPFVSSCDIVNNEKDIDFDRWAFDTVELASRS